MNLFENRTDLDKETFKNLAYNLYSHSRLRKADREGIRIIYVESAAQADSPGIYVVMNKELYSGDYSSVSPLADTFILNPSERFSAHGAVEASEANKGAYVANFDVFGNIYFHAMNFFSDESAAYGDRPYAEYMMDIFASAATDSGGGALKIEEAKLQACVLHTFDIDRLHYFALSADIRNSFYAFLLRRKSGFEYLRRRREAKKDPWNNIDELLSLIGTEKGHAAFFILSSARDKFARRYSSEDALEVFKKVSAEHDAGAHLTHESGDRTGKINDELRMLEKIFGSKILSTRFHYLHSLNREIMQQLQKSGIEVDSSVGFRDRTGFRSGFSKPYILPECGVVEVPVICMDSALVMQSMKDGAEMGSILEKLIEHIVKTGGAFTYIFHQSALDEETFSGYREVFEILSGIGRKHRMANPRFLDYALSFKRPEEWEN